MGKTYRYDPYELDYKQERHVIKKPGYGKRKKVASYKEDIIRRQEERRFKELERDIFIGDDNG